MDEGEREGSVALLRRIALIHLYELDTLKTIFGGAPL